MTTAAGPAHGRVFIIFLFLFFADSPVEKKNTRRICAAVRKQCVHAVENGK